jgi:hypothetical protein
MEVLLNKRKYLILMHPAAFGTGQFVGKYALKPAK